MILNLFGITINYIPINAILPSNNIENVTFVESSDFQSYYSPIFEAQKSNNSEERFVILVEQYGNSYSKEKTKALIAQ